MSHSQVFAQAKSISVEGLGNFDAYANRDSLSYRSIYGIDTIPTMLRGTLRMTGFCKAWNAFVQLGLTDDSWKIHHVNKLSYSQLIDSFLPVGNGTIKDRTTQF